MPTLYTSPDSFLDAAKRFAPGAAAIRAALLFKPDYVRIGIIQLDATISEVHTSTAALTDHPVEVGADITDHIRAEPRQLQINGIVSDTPISFFASINRREAPSRSYNAWKDLRTRMDKGELVNVHTKLEDYLNMAITSLSVTRDASTGQVVNMQISLREVLLAETRRVEGLAGSQSANKARVAKKKARSAEQNLSKKPIAEAKTLLKDAVDGVVGQLKGLFGG